MSGPQKPGDKYNYDVAAFLKTNKFELSSDLILNLCKNNFDAAPPSFPPDATSFNQEISMDLLISTSEKEYLCECKSSDKSKNLKITSKEFKETLLEFIGLEDYKKSQLRNVTYLLITNMGVSTLREEISALKSDSDELLSYSVKLEKQAKNKWLNFDSRIEPQSIIFALENLLIIKIDKGQLRQAEKNPKFQTALTNIIRSIEKKHPNLIPFYFSKKVDLRLELRKKQNKFIKHNKLGFIVEIEEDILNQVIKFELTLQEVIFKATVNQLPFLMNYRLQKKPGISNNLASKIITESINDLVEKKLKSIQCLAIFFPTLSEMYFAKIDWASNKVDQHFSASTNRYSLIQKNELKMVIPPYVSIFLITETKRLVNAIVVDPIQIDQIIDDDSY